MRRLLVAVATLGLLAAFFGTAFHMGPTPATDSSPAAVTAPAWGGSGVAHFVRMESSAPVFDVLYRYGQNIPAASGAYGPNATLPRSAWYVEYQRAGAVDIEDGVLRGDPTLITLGLKIFHFGLAREAPNGSFPGSAWPFHGTALFLSEAAPALVLLKASSYAGQFSSDLAADTALMRRAAHYMVSTVGGPGKIDDHTKNHRFYEAAIALGASGTLAGDRALVSWSRQYAREGIRMERPDGVMPEDGGHDSGYQAMGMVSAARYLDMVASGGLEHALRAALQRGEEWELSRVAPDGSINQAGDTRTAGCREHDPAGRCKTVFYAPIFSALAHWAAISGNGRFARASHQVWLRSGYGGR